MLDQNQMTLAKDRFIEMIKYDHNQHKGWLVFIAKLFIFSLIKLGQYQRAFRYTSHVFRTGWAGSYELGIQVSSYFFVQHPDIGKRISDAFTETQAPQAHTQKFFDDPTQMLDGIITVLKSPNKNEKGALIINYSYYFPLFIKYFDVEEIAHKYHIILEPSWAGFCEENILAYTQFDFPIFLQTYEARDRAFIHALGTNIKTIDVGPSWFINHDNFSLPLSESERDIDVIMVAAWAKFKRHRAFFKALAQNLPTAKKLKIVCVGYPVDLTSDDIRQYAREVGLEEQLTIFEWITPEEVSDLQKRAKVNVLWSKFEGNNRAIIEGMFCGTPVIMREGHNYGENYDFINPYTGKFANESTLIKTIESVINKQNTFFKPRDYVMQNRNCISGTEQMSRVLREYEESVGNPWSQDLAIKVNDLHGMTYFNVASDRFTEDYQYIEERLKKGATHG